MYNNMQAVTSSYFSNRCHLFEMAVFSSAKVIPVNGSRRMRIAPILKACTALLMLVALDQTLAFFRASQIRYMHDEVAQLLEAQSLRLTELNSLKARAGSSRKEIAQLRLDEGKIQEQVIKHGSTSSS